jgi:predicted RNase H-like HicB family nuclease
MLFPVVIHKDPDSDYGVTVPDLPGCFSAGETLAEAVANAREAIELHIEGLLEAGEAVNASDPANHQDNPDYAGGIWYLVTVNPANLRGNAQRVNITIPERVLGRIDRAAKAIGSSRSEFLVTAALRYASGPLQVRETDTVPRRIPAVPGSVAGRKIAALKAGRRTGSGKAIGSGARRRK